MLHPTLAGHTPLQDMIQQTIESAREKLAEAEEKKDMKGSESKEHEAKEKKMSPAEKAKEEAKEKNSAAILDYQNPEEMDKLASALDEMAEELVKEADSIENGGESHQGGQQLATMSPVGGKQNYKKDSAKHQVPNSTGLIAAIDDKGAKTAVPTDDHRAPGGNGAKYPAKGVLKTAGENPFAAMAAKKDEKKEEPKKEEKGEKKEDKKDEEKEKKSSAVERLQDALDKMAGADYGKSEKDEQKRTSRGYARAGAIPGALIGGALGAGGKGGTAKKVAKGALGALIGGATTGGGAYATSRAGNRIARAVGQVGEKKKDEGGDKEKKSAADFILSKVAEFHGGGETLDSAAGQGPKPPAQPGRSVLKGTWEAVKNFTKREAKEPRKAELKQVLTEPAMTSSTDSKVQDNLRNAAKGGVKIAGAKEELLKIAADPTDPRHEALKSAIAKRKAEKDGGEKQEEKKEEKDS